jgi:hypothetical protein
MMLLLSSAVANAQQWPFEFWHDGKVVLLEGDTLKGQIKYDLQQDLVQYVYKERKAEVYTARKVLFFEIFDASVKHYRQFFALPYTTSGHYKAPIFFELLSEGKMTLLTREFIEYKNYSSMYYAGSYSRQVLSYKYFFLKEDGTIEEFNGNRNDLLDMMGKKADDVEKFIKTNRLRYDDRYDLPRIVAYYNSLFEG